MTWETWPLTLRRNYPDTYYLRDLFVPFPCDVELTVAVPITPAAASSLLDGLVSPPLLSGGSFLFSRGMYSAHN